MHRIYRIIWTCVSGNRGVASESVAARGDIKRTLPRSGRRGSGAPGLTWALHGASLLLVLWLMSLPALAQSPAANALPTGGVVSAGQASINQSGTQMQILQGSDKAALNWQSFNIGSSAGVNFQQPSSQSVALNRVAGADPSQIFGALTANGKLILINPNGVVFGAGSRVDAAGLIATTKAMSDADFMNNDYHFQGGGSGAVRNNGTLVVAPNGLILLVADQVINTGTIQVRGGTVALLSADDLQIRADWKTLDVANAAAADMNTVTVENVGQIDVSGMQGGQITLQGGHGTTQSDGALLAVGEQRGGGVIHLSGMQVGLMRGSLTDASGAAGGGEVLVGGDWQGSGNMARASASYMDADAVVKVNATGRGNGGKVVLWSDGYTNFRGQIQANGAGTGNGGQVETSGHDTLDASGLVTAQGMQAGMWLLDPSDVTITSSPGGPLSGGIYNPTGMTGTISNATINDALDAGTSVTISTSLGTGGRGRLVQNADADIFKSSGGDASLALIGVLDITLNGNIRSTSGKLNLSVDAGSGVILLYKDVDTHGGTLAFNSGVYAGGSSLQSFTTSGGSILFNNDLLIADGVTIDTTGPAGVNGAVTFMGKVDSADAYDYFSTRVTWEVAKANAQGMTGGGSAVNDSYLATPLSRFQNLIAGSTYDFSGQAWLGGTSTSGQWVWVGGIDKGKVFNTSASGNSPPPGGFTNWNANQPDNFNGVETSLQFAGANGGWNDLNPNSTWGYVRQTNLPASPLHINAGDAQVTFNDAVGSLKPLASLFVTGLVGLNGGEITTEQGQTYHNPITIGGSAPITLLQSTTSSLDIGQPIFYAQANASTLDIRAAQNVTINGPIATASGALSVNLAADMDGDRVGTVAVNSPINTNGGTITMTASSGIELNAALIAGGGNIVLTNNSIGNITAAPGGVINTTGNIDITNGAAGGVPGQGNITLRDLAGNAITVTSNVTDLAAGANAIVLDGSTTASGAVMVTTLAGDILVNKDITSTAPGNASAIIVGAGTPTAQANSAGGNVKLGNNSKLVTNATSRAIIYTGSVPGSAGVGPGAAGAPGAGNYRYNVPFNDTTRLAANPTGTYVQYREQPVLTLTPFGKVYDSTALDTLDWSIYTVAGWQNGDTGAVNPLGGNLTLNNTPGLVAIDANMYAATSEALIDTLGYKLEITPGSNFTITQRPVTLSDVLVTTRTYDSTTNAQYTGGNVLGVVGVDSVNVTLVGTTVQFADKNAGVNKSVLVNAGLDGTKAHNYVFDSQGSSTTGTITPAELTLSEVTPLDRVYDGTSDVHFTGAAKLEGVLGDDSKNVFAPVQNIMARFSDKNVGIEKAVIANSTTVGLTGLESGNYVVTRVIASDNNASVTPALLQVNATPTRKLFDATNDSDTPATIIGLMSGDGLANVHQQFNNPVPGKAKTLSVFPGFMIEDGNSGNNYLITSSSAQGEIQSIPVPSGMGSNRLTPDSMNVALLTAMIVSHDFQQKFEQADYFLQPGDEPRNSTTHARTDIRNNDDW